MENEFISAGVGQFTIGLDGKSKPVSPFDLDIYNLNTGEKVKDVVECNVEEGTLIRLLRDGEGNYFLNAEKDCAARETIDGNFIIVMREGVNSSLKEKRGTT